jgi:Bacterial PH domain
MSQMDDKLLANEAIVFRTEKHWFAPASDSGVAVLMIIGALVVAWLQTDQITGVMGFVNRVLDLLRLGLFLGGVGWIIYNIVAWRTAEYGVTNMRVLGHEGLLRSRSTDTLLTSLSDVRIKIPAIGKMLGFGNITVMSASGDAGQDQLTSVKKVEEFKKAIFEQKTAQGDKTIAAMAAAANSGPGSSVSPTAALADLAKLRDSCAITAAEFEGKKAELLSRI